MKEGISKGMNMKWSLYMSSNQQNLTIGSIRQKSDYRVVKISLTTGLGSYPEYCDKVSPVESPCKFIFTCTPYPTQMLFLLNHSVSLCVSHGDQAMVNRLLAACMQPTRCLLPSGVLMAHSPYYNNGKSHGRPSMRGLPSAHY